MNHDQTLRLLQASNDLAAQRATIKTQAATIADRDHDILLLRAQVEFLEARLLRETTRRQRTG